MILWVEMKEAIPNKWMKTISSVAEGMMMKTNTACHQRRKKEEETIHLHSFNEPNKKNNKMLKERRSWNRKHMLHIRISIKLKAAYLISLWIRKINGSERWVKTYTKRKQTF